MASWTHKLGFIRNNLVLKILIVISIATWPAEIGILEYSTYVTKQAFLNFTGQYFTQSLNNYATAIDQKLFNLHNDLVDLSGSSASIDYLTTRNSTNQAKLNQK